LIEASTRFAPILAILFGLTAVMPFLHRGSRSLQDDCRDSAALLQRLAENGPGEGDGPEAPAALERRANASWVARTLPLESADETLDFFVVRAFHPNLVYQQPESTFLDLGSPSRRSVEEVQHGDDELPVHRVHYEAQQRRVSVVGYLVVFDSKPVRNLFFAEFLAAPGQLLHGRKPIWLFFASGTIDWKSRAEAEQTLRAALVGAWDDYKDVCLP
jgi:hypothetical protein